MSPRLPLPRRRVRGLAVLAAAAALALSGCVPQPSLGSPPPDQGTVDTVGSGTVDGPPVGATVPAAPSPSGTAPGDAVPTPVTGGVTPPTAVPGGAPLGATGGDVTVPAGEVRTLVGQQTAGILTVAGTLTCDPAGFDLTARVIHVVAGGQFQCGTPDAPFTGRGTITMTGERSTENVGGCGTKALCIDGGVLSLQGAPNLITWTDGVQSAAAGSDVLVVRDAPDWEPGDRIVVTGNGGNPYEAPTATEYATVASVEGTTVRLTAPLTANHPVSVESQGGKTLEMVFEVGLLSRNLVFQGDEGSRVSEFGGHVMVHNGGQGFVSEVQFQRTGQKRVHGRYGMPHFHGLGDGGRGQYLKNSSLTEGYYRAGVIHDTNGVTFSGNVVHGTFGQGMYLECGSEIDNVLDRNLVGGIQELTDDQSTTHVQERSPSLSDNKKIDWMPSAFYSLNPANSWTNNSAYDSEGGYWLNGAETPVDTTVLGCAKPYEGDLVRRGITLKQFDGNRAHDIWENGRKFDYDLGGFGLYTSNYASRSDQRFVFANFNAYNTGGKAVVAAGLVQGGRFANNAWLNHGALLFRDTLVVGEAGIASGLSDTAPRGAAVGQNGLGVNMIDTVFAQFPERGNISAVFFDRGHGPMFYWDDQLDGSVPDDAMWIPTFTGNQLVGVERPVYFPADNHVRQGQNFNNFVIGEDGTLLGGQSVWFAGHATAPVGCAADPARNTLSCATGGAVVPGTPDQAPAGPNSWYFGTAVAPGGSYSGPSVVVGTRAGDSVTLNGRTVTFGPENAITWHGEVLNYAARVG